MASKKTGPDHKRAMRSVLKTELQTLLDKLAANGEESLVLTATLGDSKVISPVYSKLGEEFFLTEKDCFQDLGRRFHSFCQGHTSTQKSPARKRKRSIDDEDDDDDYTEMEEVILFVTNPDGKGSESTVKTSVTSGDDITVHDEGLQQVTIPAENDDTARDQIFIISQSDDPSGQVWAGEVAEDTDASSQESEMTESQEEFRKPSVYHKTVDVTGSPRVNQRTAWSMSGENSKNVLVRKESDRFVSVPVNMSPSQQREEFERQKPKFETGANRTPKLYSSPNVEKIEDTPLTRYVKNMATGKSIMIRAGEECFEEIETISIADTYNEFRFEYPATPSITDIDSQASVDSRTSVDSQMNDNLESSAASMAILPETEQEVIITETGDKVHIIKNPTNEEETYDIPFEDMFDLLGKNCKCLVCGKIMLKRNRRYHWRFHTGAKPYVCSYCSKKFYHPSNLKSHMFIHTARHK